MKLQKLEFEDAVKLMKTIDKAEVFTDKGWGDQNIKITIIRDGDGQSPLAEITSETLQLLKNKKQIGQNCLYTYKARELYPFIGK